MMKLVLAAASFIVIFSGECLGFPDGLEAKDSADGPQRHIDGPREHNSVNEDLHFPDEIESSIYVDEDQHLKKGKAANERESRGNSEMNILRRLENDLQVAITKLDSLFYVNSNQDTKLDSLSSAISNQRAMLDSSRDCPIGFFRNIPTSQCFKYFADALRNYTEADAKCRKEKLTLAQPLDPVSVRSFISANYGTRNVWLGARGDNTTVVWQRGGQAISNQDKEYWYNAVQVTSRYCLEMMSHVYWEKRAPNKPYYSVNCGERQYHTLCELTMD